MPRITSKLSNLTSSHHKDDEDDFGKPYSPDQQELVPRSHLRVSAALKEFIVNERLLSSNHDTVEALLEKNPVRVPEEMTEKGHPLTEYFIDSRIESSIHEKHSNEIVNMSALGLSSLHELGSKANEHASSIVRAHIEGDQSHKFPILASWSAGASICVLDRERYNSSLQINEAMFADSDGFILKPAALASGRNGKPESRKERRLILHIAGVTDLPTPADQDSKPFVASVLEHPTDGSKRQKTSSYKQTKNEPSPPKYPVFHEKLEWVFDTNELTFLRILIRDKEEVLAVAAIRLSYAVPGWHFLRMKDTSGRETRCTMLVKFEVNDLIPPGVRFMPGWGS